MSEGDRGLRQGRGIGKARDFSDSKPPLALEGAPERIPGVAALILSAAASARRRPLATFLGLPLTALLAIGGCLVPLVNFAFILIALAPVVGSLPMIALTVARGERAPFYAPLLGFRRYERFLGLFWVPYLFAAGASAPLLVALWIDKRVLYGAGGAWLFFPAALLSGSLLLALLHRYALAPFAAADLDRRLPLGEVLDRAAALLDGRRLAVLSRLSWIALFGLGGGLAFGVGLLITAPLAAVAAARLYEHAAVRLPKVSRRR